MLRACAVLAILGGIFLYAFTLTQGHGSRKRHPPGPRTLPVIGNALSFATKYPWKRFRDWSAMYGPVVHLEVFGYSIIILNSPKVAFDLLDGRSAVYSDRPNLTMKTLLDLSWVIPLMPYGERWRKHRRMVHKYLNKTASKSYEPTQIRKARQLLIRIRKEPGKWVDHTNFAIASVLLDLTYGDFDEATSRRYIRLAQETAEALAEMFLPGTLLVQYVPFLQYMPSWFPGARFKTCVDEWREVISASVNEPFASIQGAMASGNATPTFLTQMLDEIAQLEGAEYDEAETIAKNCAAVVYGAGSDTTISTLMTFYLAMILHPDAQKKAQEELMAVVGPDRLPEFHDRPSLPYVNALVKECTRWIPVTPLGAFHATSEDDVYQGYYIPKGSIVFPNQWAMLHDPDEYPDPESFNPERFLKNGVLNPNVRDPNTVAFGFGRRICPGRDVSDATVFICIASILHAFDIRPHVDKSGSVKWPKIEVASSLVAHPLPFDCDIVPRCDGPGRLVESMGII